jgi:ABC-2 type transport system ATP-binding protein
VTGSPKGASVRLSGGDAQLAEVVRALDAENIEIQELQLHAPTLDDVFLAKTGRSLEGAAEEAEAGPDAEAEGEPQPLRA